MAATSPTDAAALFERHRQEVYGWAYRVLGRHHDAQDVVQDVFLRWRQQVGRQPPFSPRGWLRRTTLNRALDLVRRRRETPRLTDVRLPHASDEATVEDADRDQLRSDINAALNRLTDAQRGVLVAKVYDGLTFARIATESGLALGTVKTHYLRALAAVRDRLSGRWDTREAASADEAERAGRPRPNGPRRMP